MFPGVGRFQRARVAVALTLQAYRCQGTCSIGRIHKFLGASNPGRGLGRGDTQTQVLSHRHARQKARSEHVATTPGGYCMPEETIENSRVFFSNKEALSETSNHPRIVCLSVLTTLSRCTRCDEACRQKPPRKK